MRSRWFAASSLGLALGLVGVVLPLVHAAAPPSAPAIETTVERLVPADRTVRAGWSDTVEPEGQVVSLRWQGAPDAEFTIETRDDGGRWRDAGEVGPVDGGPDPGTPEWRQSVHAGVSEPLWVGDADEVRIRLADGAVRALDVHEVDPGEPAARPGVAGAATSPVPRIIGRTEWGADENLRLGNCPGAPSQSANVKLAVIHHTAGSNSYSPGQSASIVRGLYGYATQTLRYCDTHYNFFIDRYGQIFEGRYGGVDRPILGAHTTGANSNTTGIAFIGDFSSTPIPEAAIESLKALLAWKLAWHGVDPTRFVEYTTPTGTDRWPAGSTRALPMVIGHRDPGTTTCPGNFVYGRLGEVRAEVARRMLSQPIDTFPAWQPRPGQWRLASVNAFGALYPAGDTPPVLPTGVWPGFPIARDLVLRGGGVTGGYVLDGFGGIHPFGGAPRVTGGPYFGFDIARDIALRPDGVSGWVLDGWGGVHPFGGAPALPATTYFRGFDIARRITPVGTGAYVLDGFGGVHRVGNVPVLPPGPYWPGWDVARDLVVRPGTSDLYVLDGFGGLYPLGGAPAITSPWWGRNVAKAAVLVPGNGGYAIAEDGEIRSFDGARVLDAARSTYVGSTATMTPWTARGIAFG